uniref:Uncharacterized protein n=1 Tax=Romanomermis culicivorax TaxID=13658 RepID=A0A915J5U7_ROMCU
MSTEKRRKEDNEESECRGQQECEKNKKSQERRHEGDKDVKEHRDSQKSQIQLLASTVVPLPTQFQMAQFPMMHQGPYYHQFLVPQGVHMPPTTMIPPMRSMQGEERMDIPRPSMVMPPPQRPPSAANPDYISPLKWDTEIGQQGWDHSGQRHK